MTNEEARKVITQGIFTRNKELLVLESDTLRQIQNAYKEAMDEIARELNQRYSRYVVATGRMSEAQLKLAQTKLLRDAKLYENLNKRLITLGGKVDRIDAMGALNAAGISNEWVKREFESICQFTNLDPSSFALINHTQAELAVNQVNKGTKFINEQIRKDTLKDMRQQMRISILKGESIEDLTQRIVSKTALTLEGVSKGVFSSIEQRARLNARWGIIESANASAIAQYESFNTRVGDAGLKELKVMKQAIAHIDDRTTLTCIYVNGQIQPLEKPFETDQGYIDYAPFHPNCRTAVSSWHQAFEAYGRNTQDMLKTSREELKKRDLLYKKKTKGKTLTKKQVSKRKTVMKKRSKSMNATSKTDPGASMMPSKNVQKAIDTLEPNEAAQVLAKSTNTERLAEIKNVQTDRKVLDQALWKAESAIKNRKTEEAFIFDDAGNILLEKGGSRSQVAFTYKEAELFENNIMLHNHPSDGPFSGDDIFTMINTKIKETRVVGEKHRHIMRAKTQGVYPEISEFKNNYSALSQKHYNKGKKYFNELLGEGIDPTLANKMASHKVQEGVWKEMMELFGDYFEYTVEVLP